MSQKEQGRSLGPRPCPLFDQLSLASCNHWVLPRNRNSTQPKYTPTLLPSAFSIHKKITLVSDTRQLFLGRSATKYEVWRIAGVSFVRSRKGPHLYLYLQDRHPLCVHRCPPPLWPVAENEHRWRQPCLLTLRGIVGGVFLEVQRGHSRSSLFIAA